MGKLRVASFNVENLFSRARVFMFDEAIAGSAILQAVAELQALLEKSAYNAETKADIVRVVNENQLLSFINIRCDRVNAEGASPKFLFLDDDGAAESVNSKIRGREDWIGAIEFSPHRLPPGSTETMRKVIVDELKPDILCLVEVESRWVLRQFNEQVLGEKRYPYEILVEGNDRRGIDVAVLSRYPIGAVRSNTAMTVGEVLGAQAPAGTANKTVFDRDCLEVEIQVATGFAVTVLCNHLKSKSGDETKTDSRRIHQAKALVKILNDRHRDNDVWRNVIVAGDLNEHPDRDGANPELEGFKTSISPLLDAGIVKSALDGKSLEDRYTYVFDNKKQQIDHLLLTSPLASRVRSSGVVRSGRFTDGQTGPARPIDAASDHGAVWVELDVPELG